MKLLARALSQLPTMERSEHSKNLTIIGTVILFFGLAELFWVLLTFFTGTYSCPAGGCDTWLIYSYSTVQNFPWLVLGLLSIGTGTGIIAYGSNYDSHRKRGLILLILAIIIAIGIISTLFVLSEDYLTANGIYLLNW